MDVLFLSRSGFTDITTPTFRTRYEIQGVVTIGLKSYLVVFDLIGPETLW